jgi:NAD(P)-dependent dehydrogenase (short-subunit alcohol dehydrogenase family)
VLGGRAERPHYTCPVNRVVVVTGSSSGIGLATALAFARAGDAVVATLRDPTGADELRAAVAEAEVDLEVLGLDVTDDEAVARVVGDVLARYGRVDVLVNNAGAPFTATLEELPISELHRSMDVNFFGVVRTTKAVLPAMRAAGGGHLIAVTSLGGVVGQPFNDAYCAAKFAVEGLYESLHPVAAAFGVHVSIVEPGPVDTRFDEKAAPVDAEASAPFATLRARYRELMDSGSARRQPPADVGDLIVGIADEARPVLRYQTGKLVSRIAAMKLADMTGERITALTATWLAEPPAI